MSMIARIQQEMTDAMKTRQTLRLSVLRGIKTALKNKEIEKVRPLTEVEEIQVLQTLVKQRRESIEQFTKGGRNDLVSQEKAELEILETFLPAAVGRDEIDAAVAAAIDELQAASPKDMGRVMKAVMGRFAGKVVDGKMVNELVRAKLGSTD
ncbi:MAG: GatB/YqeY domain-containing protein [Acidobacteria bacterium]|nr:MAG: GatB/YqeY domain-containing protein [Acidobacteriota bacterium]